MRRHILFPILAAVLLAAPVSARAASPHAVIVAQLDGDGTVVAQRSTSCDLAASCEVALEVQGPTPVHVMLRLFADDDTGVSLVPISSDEEGHFARGRRIDVAWSGSRTLSATVRVQPMSAQGGDGLYDRGVREDSPALAMLAVAVKDTSPNARSGASLALAAN